MSSGRIVGQARFIPLTAVSAAQIAVTIGPVLAMVALQMQLSEIRGLVRSNIALTGQVLTTIRHGQWAELTALVATVDHVVQRPPVLRQGMDRIPGAPRRAGESRWTR
jgi:hypothetical protein